MLTLGIKIKLVVFVVVAIVATMYLGVRYMGWGVVDSGYRVSVTMPNGGGTFDNGEVTFRGVPVGRIEQLSATPEGVRAVLAIDGGSPDIPSDVSVKVANRSAIGEQYIDLRGGTGAAEPLADGDTLHGTEASQPPAIDEVLRSGRDFVESVPKRSLTTVIDESYEASRGAANHLGRLLEASQKFQKTADKNFLVTSALIENSSTVLATQERSAASIRSFSRDLDVIASTLESSDGDLRKLIDSSPAAAREFDRLFKQVGQPLGVLMGNLVSTAQVFGINATGIEDALIRAPEAVSIGWAVNGSRGLDLGLAQTYFDPLPCTSGYGDTAVRRGTDTGEGDPFNLKAGCSLDPSTGVNVRGPKSVPAKSTAPSAARVTVASSLADLMGGGQ